MAQRPIYIANLDDGPLVLTRPITFQWFPGLSVSQKQKSIDALHAAAAQLAGIGKVLEISSKSRTPLGIALSAFNLPSAPAQGHGSCVECAYQGSKVFEHGGPFLDLFDKSAREARNDVRLQSSGRLLSFSYKGSEWPLEPRTAFYDWLYLHALQCQPTLREQLLGYQAFTDIELNPARSINCQAHAAALFVSLHRRSLLQQALSSKAAFLSIVGG